MNLVEMIRIQGTLYNSEIESFQKVLWLNKTSLTDTSYIYGIYNSDKC